MFKLFCKRLLWGGGDSVVPYLWTQKKKSKGVDMKSPHKIGFIYK